ncbi:hypothetical protein BVC80_6759g4 [Macleaya cordata]|uniref:Uncharacterized protein n=1 Tax=Macleaya cordata TaxID=56857 RepID=A0A200R0V9_MACCD|nr:hypothetical protein BVC80_6759g4 [Macleaya cordata]
MLLAYLLKSCTTRFFFWSKRLSDKKENQIYKLRDLLAGDMVKLREFEAKRKTAKKNLERFDVPELEEALVYFKEDRKTEWLI